MASPSTHHEEEQLGKIYDARTARRLITYLAPYRKLTLAAVVLTISMSLVSQVGPLLTKLAIDDYIAPTVAGNLSAERAMEGLVTLVLAYLVSLAAALGLGYFQTLFLNVIGQRVMFDLRQQIFARLQSIELSYYDRNPVGRLMTRLTSDVDSLNELFTSGLVEVLGDLVLVVAALGMMFYFNWRLALVSLVVVPLLVAATAWFRRGAREGFRQVRTRIARLNAFTQEHLSGAQVVQLFSREARTFREFSAINEAHKQASCAPRPPDLRDRFGRHRLVRRRPSHPTSDDGRDPRRFSPIHPTALDADPGHQ